MVNKKSEIPKIIHYCWFGKGEKSDIAKKCIKSWQENLEGYKFIEWNETNFNININNYVKEAYENKKYAFVSDYVRLFALYNYGGIYLDTDVEVINNFDNFIQYKLFVGFEDTELVSTAVIGSKKNHNFIKEWLDTYNKRKFIVNGKFDDLTNVRVLTNLLLKYNLVQNNSNQQLMNEEISIFSTEYFSPLKFGAKNPKITLNTITIHWFEGTWTSIGKKIKIKLIIFIKDRIGFELYNKIKKIIKNR